MLFAAGQGSESRLSRLDQPLQLQGVPSLGEDQGHPNADRRARGHQPPPPGLSQSTWTWGPHRCPASAGGGGDKPPQ